MLDLSLSTKVLVEQLLAHFKPNASFVKEHKPDWFKKRLDPISYNKMYHEIDISIKAIQLVIDIDPFPGRSDKDFQKLKDILRELNFLKEAPLYLDIRTENIPALELYIEEIFQQHGVEIKEFKVSAAGKCYYINLLVKEDSTLLVGALSETDRDIYSITWECYKLNPKTQLDLTLQQFFNSMKQIKEETISAI